MLHCRNEITVKIAHIIQRTYLSLENGRLETSSSCDWGLELGDLSASPGSTCHHQKEHIPPFHQATTTTTTNSLVGNNSLNPKDLDTAHHQASLHRNLSIKAETKKRTKEE
jgi:hypothetical protein